MRNLQKLFFIVLFLILGRSVFSQTLVPFLKANGKYIYVDSASMMPVDNREFFSARIFGNGGALCDLDHLIYREVDRTGQERLIYDEKNHYHFLGEGYYAFARDTYIYLVKTDGYSKKEIYITKDPYGSTGGITYKGYGIVQVRTFEERTSFLINKNLNIVYNMQLHNDFKNGLCAFHSSLNDTKFGVVDSNLKIILFDDYDEISFGENNIIKVKKNNKYGFFSKAGEKITEIKYDEAEDFSDGLALVRKEKNRYFINVNEEIILKEFGKPYKFFGSFHDGMAVISKDFLSESLTDYYETKMYKKSFGYINKQGQMITIPKFDMEYELSNYSGASDFKEGLATVSLQSLLVGEYGTVTATKSGIINKQGKLIIPLIDGGIGNFKEGYAIGNYPFAYGGGLQGLSFYINTKGEILKYKQLSTGIEPTAYGISSTPNWIKKFTPTSNNFFRAAKEFNNGLAIVAQFTKNDREGLYYGVINKQGDWVLKPIYNEILYEDGFFKVSSVDGGKNSRLYYYIDMNGRPYKE